MLVKFKIFFLFLTGTFMTLMSCQKDLTLEEYSAYISNPENGLRINQNLGDFELSAMFEPSVYFTKKQNGDLTLDEVSQFEHFQFRIKLNSGGNILMYKETQLQNEVTRINHFGFMGHQDFHILTAQDTFDCKLAHFSRNYNLSPTIDLSLAFDAIPKNDDWQLIYNDQQFNLGRIKFLFKSNDLENIPELKR